MIAIDSNVLVYAHDVNDSDKHFAAKELLKTILIGKRKAAVCTQSIAEFFSVSTRKLHLSIPEAQETVNDLLDRRTLILCEYNISTVRKAMRKTKHTTRFWDTLIATTLLEHGISTLYTENVKDFEGLGIEAVNPFV